MMAGRLLSNKGATVEVLEVDGDAKLRAEMQARSGRTSVPQIFIGEAHIGGCDDLHALDRAGDLDLLLFGAARWQRQPPVASMGQPKSAHESAGWQRIDNWLWAARFFKTRSAATQAVTGGKVDVAGERVKPARQIRPGTVLRIRRGVIEYEVVIQGLCAQRRPASEATLLYQETAQSIATRNEETERQRQAEHRRQTRLGRPDKHARREIVRLKGH